MDMAEYKKEVGKHIASIRRRHQMKQAEFGKLVGCSGNAVSNYEKGRRLFPLDMATTVVKELGATLEYIYGEQDVDSMEDDDFIRMYKGSPPEIRRQHRRLWQAMHAEDDAETE
jgi:transcriptional regulator with XRE-family HTH domain